MKRPLLRRFVVRYAVWTTKCPYESTGGPVRFPFLPPFGAFGTPDIVIIEVVEIVDPFEKGEPLIARTDDGTEVTLDRVYFLGVSMLTPQVETKPMHEQLVATIDGVDYRITPCRGGRHYHIREAIGDEGSTTA